MQAYFSKDTIVALATPAGGALAVIRWSGPLALSLLTEVTQREALDFPPFRVVKSLFWGQSFQGERIPLEEALFVFFKAPASFTGEDLVEVTCHGGAYLLERVLETLLQGGARFALPGEFTFRGVQQGKRTLFQAQAIQDLFEASSDTAISLALEKLSGRQNQVLEALRKKLRDLMARSELGIDFSDQEVEELSLPQLKQGLEELRLILLHWLESYEGFGKKIQEGFCITLAGLPNAGKSSFFNVLLGEQRSLVSPFAGTTRDLVSEKILLKSSHSKQSMVVRLEDTAGLRNTLEEIEAGGIQKAQEAIQRADRVLFLMDGVPSGTQKEAFLQEWKRLALDSTLCHKTIGIVTKRDLFSPQDLDFWNSVREAGNLFEIPFQRIFLVSSLTQEGVREVIDFLLEDLGAIFSKRSSSSFVLTRLEHVRAVEQGLQCLDKTIQEAQNLEFLAADLRHLSRVLNPILGETLMEDVLSEIFSRFCIGK